MKNWEIASSVSLIDRLFSESIGLYGPSDLLTSMRIDMAYRHRSPRVKCSQMTSDKIAVGHLLVLR